MKQLLLFFILCPFLGFSQWTQINNDIDANTFDRFGASVSLSGDGTVVAAGAIRNNNYTGAVRVFNNNLGSWIQIGQAISGDAINDEFGRTLSLSNDGSILAIGTPNNNSFTGQVKVYENIAGTWTQIGSTLTGATANANFGFSVSLSSDGTKLAVGSPANSGYGVIQVFEFSGTWTQLGSDLVGDVGFASLFFGTAVSISNNGLVVAGLASGGNGMVRLREYNAFSNNWTQIGSDIAPEVNADYSLSPHSISLNDDGSIIAIGAENNDGNGTNSGHIRVYQRVLNSWSQVGNDIDGALANDNFGTSVSLSNDGTSVAVGAIQLNSGGGYAQVLKNIAGVWTQSGSNIVGELPGGGVFGTAIGLNGTGSIVAVGDYFNNGGGIQAGHVRVLQDSPLSLNENDITKLKLTPNPIQSNFNITSNVNIDKVEVFNINGQKIKIFNTVLNNYNIKDLQSGVYFVKIYADSFITTKKIIKN